MGLPATCVLRSCMQVRRFGQIFESRSEELLVGGADNQIVHSRSSKFSSRSNGCEQDSQGCHCPLLRTTPTDAPIAMANPHKTRRRPNAPHKCILIYLSEDSLKDSI